MILALETSGSACSVALSHENKILSILTSYSGNSHDRLLAEFVRRILHDNKIGFENIDAVAISSGPGSFTGLRIGAALAKGLCFANTTKLISIPTLNAIAYSAIDFVRITNAEEIIAMIPSHKELVYLQKFDNNANPSTEIMIVEQSQLTDIVRSDSIVVGPASNKIDKGIKINSLNIIDARMIVSLAEKYYIDNKFCDTNQYDPLYIQEFEPKLKQKNKE